MSENKKIDKFEFSPSEGFLDAHAFPDPTNETETRTQLMNLHNQTRDFINSLIASLNSPNGADNITITIDNVQYTVQEIVQSLSDNKITGESDIKRLRINEENQTEYYNGSKWQLLGSGGHVILNNEGITMPQTPQLQFENAVVENKGRITVVHGIKGEQGEVGPQGPQGLQGPVGPQGSNSTMIPSSGFFTLEVDGNGNLYAVYPTEDISPQFEYDSYTGNLYWVMEI